MTKRGRRSDGAATLERVFETALRLFRKRGFDETTMRQIATKAGLSLGAAYHYFPSKSAIVLEYYRRVQHAHAAAVSERLASATTLRDRLGAAIHSKLDLLRDDRRLLAAIARSIVDPFDALSLFAETTEGIRRESMVVFEAAVDHPDVPAPMRPMLALTAWTLHMGIVLFFVHDNSPGQAKTRRLLDDALDLAVPILPLLGMPGLDGLFLQGQAALARAGLMKDFSSVALPDATT